METQCRWQVASVNKARWQREVGPRRNPAMVQGGLSRPPDVGSTKGGGEVNPEMTRAATGATARVVSPMQLYHTGETKSTAINEVLARLLFALASPHVTRTDRATVLNAIDGLIRLKIDAGLLGGCRL